MTTLTPFTRYIGPFVTVCNYWNYSFTYLADHITDQDQTGGIQRIRAQDDAAATRAALSQFGQAEPIKGLHAQPYGGAVDANGDADCEQGQRGYLTHLANGVDPARQVVGEPVTPGQPGHHLLRARRACPRARPSRPWPRACPASIPGT